MTNDEARMTVRCISPPCEAHKGEMKSGFSFTPSNTGWQVLLTRRVKAAGLGVVRSCLPEYITTTPARFLRSRSPLGKGVLTSYQLTNRFPALHVQVSRRTRCKSRDRQWGWDRCRFHRPIPELAS